MPDAGPPAATPFPISTETQTYIDCHEQYTPGIIEDWRTSRHARTSPADALARPELERRAALRGVCVSCYGSGWTDGHRAKLDSTLQETDAMLLDSTAVLSRAWERRLADRKNPFDESIEQQWICPWLFYANAIRYASAMSAPDYAAFKNGWWELAAGVQRMHEWVHQSGKKWPRIPPPTAAPRPFVPDGARAVAKVRACCYLVSRITGRPSFPDPTMMTLVLGELASFSVASTPFHRRSWSLIPWLTIV